MESEGAGVIIAGLFLLVGGVYDRRYRKIPLWLLTVAGTAGLLNRLSVGDFCSEVMIPGMILSGVFLFVSWITKEALGYGDSLGILVLALCLSFERLLWLLNIGFFLLFLMGLWHLAVNKGKKTDTMPMFPLLAAAYLGVFLT